MTAMMWKALIHSYIVYIFAGIRTVASNRSRQAAHARNQSFHMCDRRLRQHAMTEIENERPSGKGLESGIDGAIKRCAADEEGQWIEIALNRPPALNLVAREARLNHPIKTHRIDGNGRDITRELC